LIVDSYVFIIGIGIEFPCLNGRFWRERERERELLSINN